MISKSRLKPITALALCAVTVPLLISACNPSDNPVAAAQNGLCCTKFVVGADMTGVDFGLTGQVDGKFKAFAQAGSDLAAVASASLTDVALACENIARDVGATPAKITTV